MIRGESVSLRPLAPRDRDRFFAMLRDPLQLAFGSPAFVEPPRVPSDVLARIEESAARVEAREPATLAVVDRDDVFLGDVSWRLDAAPALAVADVGYAVHPDARGRGVATAAVRLLVPWLLEDPSGPGLARVQLDHSVENLASCRVALAAGLAQEGVRRGFLPLRDAAGDVRRHDVCLHGVVAPAAQ